MSRLVFLDVETSGLDPQRHEMWEYSLIVREDDKAPWTRDVQVHVHDLGSADPMALKVNKFYERFDPQNAFDPRLVVRPLALALNGATLVGANPSFDAAFLSKFLRENNQAPAWNHRMVDVEVLAQAALRLPEPIGLVKSAEALGIEVDHAATHTASYDAHLGMDVYDLVIGGISKPPLMAVAA